MRVIQTLKVLLQGAFCKDRLHSSSVVGGFLLGLALCSGLFSRAISSQTPTSSDPTILISAAASLQEVLQTLDPIFDQRYPEIRVRYNFGSSGSLQKQIEQGAPVDLFISASPQQMDELEQAGLLQAESRRVLLKNRLVLIKPKHSVVPLSSLSDLTSDEIKMISVGEFHSVPAGQYAAEVFHNLNLTARIQPKLVFASSVRGVLAAVESGNVDAGVVYASDALLSDQVEVSVLIDETLHSPIVYPIAILNDSRSVESAQVYLEFVTGDEAVSTFEAFGFQPL